MSPLLTKMAALQKLSDLTPASHRGGLGPGLSNESKNAFPSLVKCPSSQIFLIGGHTCWRLLLELWVPLSPSGHTPAPIRPHPTVTQSLGLATCPDAWLHLGKNIPASCCCFPHHTPSLSLAPERGMCVCVTTWAGSAGSSHRRRCQILPSACPAWVTRQLRPASTCSSALGFPGS